MLGQAQILCTVVQAEEDPVPAAEDPGHSPQQDSTEGQFLAEDVVEEHACQRQTENPPLTLEPWISQRATGRYAPGAAGEAPGAAHQVVGRVMWVMAARPNLTGSRNASLLR